MASPRALTSDQHVPELGIEVGLPIPGTVGTPPYTRSLFCLTDLAQLSSYKIQSYTVQCLSHICALSLHCYSCETCSTQFQSQFLWSLVRNASASFNSGTLELIVSAGIFSKLSDFWVTSVH